MLYFYGGDSGRNHCLGVRAVRAFACRRRAAVRRQARGDCRDLAGALGIGPHGGEEPDDVTHRDAVFILRVVGLDVFQALSPGVARAEPGPYDDQQETK